jgi:ABC-type oligopeptide transport system substrate-binding subunit
VNPKTQGPAGGFFHSIVGQDKMADGSATTISGIETPNDSAIKFTLTQPDATFLNVLALNFASLVPNEVVEAEGADFGKKPVGSGPASAWCSRAMSTISATVRISTDSKSKSARSRSSRS